MNKSPKFKAFETDMGAKDLSRKLTAKNEALYRVIRVQVHTLIVKADGIQNVVSTDRASLGETNEKVDTATSSPEVKK